MTDRIVPTPLSLHLASCFAPSNCRVLEQDAGHVVHVYGKVKTEIINFIQQHCLSKPSNIEWASPPPTPNLLCFCWEWWGNDQDNLPSSETTHLWVK